MIHYKTHCTGEIAGYTCSKRQKCLRYRLHLEARELGLSHVPYLSFVADLGYGKTFTYDIRNGCCEYIPTDKT